MPIFISFWFKMVADHLSENQASDNITHNLVPRVLSAFNKAESRPTAMLKAQTNQGTRSYKQYTFFF